MEGNKVSKDGAISEVVTSKITFGVYRELSELFKKHGTCLEYYGSIKRRGDQVRMVLGRTIIVCKSIKISSLVLPLSLGPEIDQFCANTSRRIVDIALERMASHGDIKFFSGLCLGEVTNSKYEVEFIYGFE